METIAIISSLSLYRGPHGKFCSCNVQQEFQNFNMPACLLELCTPGIEAMSLQQYSVYVRPVVQQARHLVLKLCIILSVGQDGKPFMMLMGLHARESF